MVQFLSQYLSEYLIRLKLITNSLFSYYYEIIVFQGGNRKIVFKIVIILTTWKKYLQVVNGY